MDRQILQEIVAKKAARPDGNAVISEHSTGRTYTPGRLHWACPADSETAAPSAPLILENRIRSEIWTRQIVLKTAAMLAIFSPGTGARGVERRPLLSRVKNQSRSRASLLIATISATSGQSLGQSCLAIDRPGCSGNWHG